MANGSDILVFFPCTEGTIATVSSPKSLSHGSVFIQQMIAVFERNYETEHLMDMLVEATGLICTQWQNVLIDSRTGETAQTMQMPTIHSQLRKKLFFWQQKAHVEKSPKPTRRNFLLVRFDSIRASLPATFN